MNLLKSHRNDFPEYYGEFALQDLNNCLHPLRDRSDPKDLETRTFRLESLEMDILERGLTHPIILWETKNTYSQLSIDRGVSKLTPLYVHVGSQRVHIAKKLGYTHISGYQITSHEEMNRINQTTESQEYWEIRRFDSSVYRKGLVPR